MVKIKTYSAEWINSRKHFLTACLDLNSENTIYQEYINWMARDWHATTSNTNGVTILIFENDSDAIAFKLRFG